MIVLKARQSELRVNVNKGMTTVSNDVRFRFPIAVGFLAQRQSIHVASEMAQHWAIGRADRDQSVDYARMCLREFQKASDEKKMARVG